MNEVKGTDRLLENSRYLNMAYFLSCVMTFHWGYINLWEVHYLIRSL